jgi:hypothetical protein
VVPRCVAQVYQRVSLVLDLVVEGRVIGTTGEHPFYVRDRGWMTAGELRPGHALATADGRWLPVAGINDSGRIATVYNVEVEDDHTYFEGDDDWGWSVWAHNMESVLITPPTASLQAWPDTWARTATASSTNSMTN